MRRVIEQFREWHANHFGDFSAEVNAELLCIDNAAEAALSAPTEAREKTVPELQAEIGRLTMELQFRVLGDPMGVVCTPSPLAPPQEKP